MSIENVMKLEENVEDNDDDELSLCDLPITLINIKTQDHLRKEDSLGDNETQEEFYFLISKEQEICDADDVFFQGQILPLCPSLSSNKACLLTKHNDDKGNNHQLKDSDLIRSKCLDLFIPSGTSDKIGMIQKNLAWPLRKDNTHKSLDLSLSEIQSNISPSSSVTSHSLSTTNTPRISISNSKTKNQFHTHPSPKPQPKKAQPSQTSGRKPSPTRNFLRIGVIPTPEIRLKDLKIHTTTTTATVKSFLTSATENCEGHNSKNSREIVEKSNETPHQVDNNKPTWFQKKFHKGGAFFMSGCKCSRETVCSSIVKIKGPSKSAKITESTQNTVKE